MSIYAKMLTALIITASNQTYNQDDLEYSQAISSYSKELVTAKYLVKWCSAQFNTEHFKRIAPPMLWSKERYDAYVRTEMEATKEILDNKKTEFGRKEFCKVSSDFLGNYSPNNPAIKFQ